MKKILIALPSLLMISDAFAGATPPPAVWNPEYTMRILIAKDTSAIIRENFNEYAQVKITHLNSVLNNSGANVKAVLAGTYIHHTKFNNLPEFKNNVFVESKKKSTNAHIAYLFSDLDFSATTCGRAYRTSLNQYSYSSGRAASWFCLAGDTFVHEIGHNLGLRHTPNDPYGHSPYGYTPKYAAGKGNWAWVTMMPYAGEHGGLITKQRFSNPDIKCDAFYTCGDENKSDAVRFINETAPRRFIKNN